MESESGMATTLLSKPDHVTDQLFVDFDALFDGGATPSYRTQESLSAIFNAHGPIIWTPRNGGHWIVGGYQQAFDLAHDTETFSSDPRNYPPSANATVGRPANLDPPEHRDFRAPLVAALTPAAVNALQGKIRAYARELVSAFRERGGGDMVDAIAEPLPVVVFLELLGLPTDRVPEFRKMALRMLTVRSPAERAALFADISALCEPYVEERRRERKQYLISHLLDSRINGRELTQREILEYCVMLFGAGLDTVTTTMSYGLHLLAQDLELQYALREDRSRISDAIEEFLRRYSVVQTWRYVMKDTTFHGVELKQHERVLCTIPAANLDSSTFNAPLAFDLDREDSPHIGFFVGSHRCVGSHLARLEMRIGYEELLAGLPLFRLDPAKPVTSKLGQLYGLEQVPVIWS